MVDFTARLELPEFIPKEKIIGKYVLDSEVRHIGIVEDWTYSSDGKIKMVVRTKNLAKKNPVVLIPFSHIEKVGQFVTGCAAVGKLLGDRAACVLPLRSIRDRLFQDVGRKFAAVDILCAGGARASVQRGLGRIGSWRGKGDS